MVNPLNSSKTDVVCDNTGLIHYIKYPVKVINFKNINDYYCRGYIIFKDINNIESCAIINPSQVNYIKNKYGNRIKFYLIEEKDLLAMLESSFNHSNTSRSINYLSEISCCPTAKNIDYKKMITGFLILFSTNLIFFTNLFNFVNNIIYLVQNIFKAILFKCSITKTMSPDTINISSKNYKGKLPIYTVFIPLYKEVRKLKSILIAMDKLNYPKSKLDVKFIIELDDKDMNKALSILDLPAYIHVIKVPFSLPRTKPKAMNYAVSYIKGKYLCIYDAEDRPDPNQLLKALQAFHELPDEYACVQARLNFYNSKENILTKFFSIEYKLWFEYLLQGLSLYDLPLTLGGTSNHFKVSALQKVGYWDAYNVTEDADLGIRLYCNGYKVHMIDSETLEEAPITLGNWLAQRARWIKGFIQTFYIFLIRPKLYTNLEFKKVFSVYIFVGFSSYSFFCMPWLIMIFLFELNQYIYYLWLINSIFALVYMYSSVYYITSHKNSLTTNLITILIWPFYFILHSIAAYWAVLDIFLHPFKWNKTNHGLSATELD